VPLLIDVSLWLFSVTWESTVREREKPEKEMVIGIEKINEAEYGETLNAILMGNNIVTD
jgi:hypothetical protein